MQPRCAARRSTRVREVRIARRYAAVRDDGAVKRDSLQQLRRHSSPATGEVREGKATGSLADNRSLALPHPNPPPCRGRGSRGVRALSAVPPAPAAAACRSRPACRRPCPEGPAVAGRRALHRGADLVDRAAMLGRDHVPSARTRRVQRPLQRCSTSPGCSRPRSTSQPNGIRGSSRLDGVSAARARPPPGRRRCACAPARYSAGSRSMPIQRRPRRLATAPVVPVPKNGSSTTSPGLVAARITRWSSASGFCVGWPFLPAPSLSRSPPDRSGSASRCASADRR